MRKPSAKAIGVAAVTPALMLALPTPPASAHGYVSSPASRQAQCAAGTVQCGPIKYEPQSVEGPKGLRTCHANLSQFAELSDDSKPWRATPVGDSVSMTWRNTAQHRTQSWEYWIGNKRVGYVDGHNALPGSTVTHTVNLDGFSGRQKLLAIWNIGDTANAFYSCVDLLVGEGSTPTTTTTPTTTSTPTTTTTPTTTSTPPPTTTTSTPPPTTTSSAPSGATPWKVGAKYAVGDKVTYNGKTYRCLQAHTVYDPNWTPSDVPALWQPI